VGGGRRRVLDPSQLGERLRIEHRTNAAEQGVAVARNILGERKPFAPLPYIWSDQYDRKIQIYGLRRGPTGSRSWKAVSPSAGWWPSTDEAAWSGPPSA
jgi:NADPH-dependent 2,4-dienoyl-CoA reductase/sulfur reductase-like enzyme